MMEDSGGIKIITYGCKVNQYEAALLQSNLNRHLLLKDNWVIIMSCCVTEKAEKECRQTIKKLLREKNPPKIIVSSCYARIAREKLSEEFPGVIFCPDYREIKNIFGLDSWQDKLESFSGHSRVFVKIQDGCDQFCSYCLVPYVRPGNKSRQLDEIEKEILCLADKGYAEFVLTGVRLGKYEFYRNGRKNGLVELLSHLLKLLKENGLEKRVRFRLSSLEVTEVTLQLLELFQNNPFNLCAHFHLPLQSASDRILRLMNRPYTREFYSQVVRQIQKMLPDGAVTTDVIVGFPSESEEDFQETKKFIADTGFARLHVFPYSVRPNTKAEKIAGHLARSVIQKRRDDLLELDRFLRKKFADRFIDQLLLAVSAGKDTVLTDNYLHLKVIKKVSPATPIFPVKVISQFSCSI